MSNIKDTLSEIIEKRNAKAGQKKTQADELIRKKEALLQSVNLFNKFAQLDAEEQEWMCGSKEMAEKLKDSRSAVEKCIKAYDEAIESLHKLEIRFKRKTIDLAAIGKIGAGKSMFLQSASGLDDNCIPSLPGASCTGVTSIIENIEETGKTEAHFVFKTETEVIDTINREIESLKNELERIYPIGELGEEIQKVNSLKEDEIRQPFQVLSRRAEEISEKNKETLLETQASMIANKIMKKMEEYTQEEKRKEWFPYIGSSESEMRSPESMGLEVYQDEGKNKKYIYVLSDPEKIKLFVSKHGNSAENYQEYHRYIAVKEAVIKTHITGSDARIRLMDTVGIGDPDADTVSRMESAVRYESDGVIYISPSRDRTELDATEQELLQKLRQLFREYRSEGAEYWISFVQNYEENRKKEFDRTHLIMFLKELEKTYGSNPDDLFGKNGIRYRKVVDVSSKSEVNDMLQGFLKQISDNLNSIDERFENHSNSLCRKAAAEERRLKGLLDNIHINTPKKLSQNHIYRMVNDRLGDLGENLKKYRLQIVKEGKSENTESSFLRQRIEIVRRLKDGEEQGVVHISLNEMVDLSCKENNYIADARLEAIKLLKKSVRKIATLPSETQQEKAAAYKSQVADYLVKSLRIDLDRIREDKAVSLDPDEPDFFRELGGIIFDGIYDAEELKEIFDSMAQFRLDEMNVLTKTLFYHHAEKCLTDEPYKEQQKQDGQSEGIKTEHAPVKQDMMTEWKKMHQEEKREEHISESDRNKLLEELRNKLNCFIRSVEKDTGEETYLVDYYDQMNEELYNFMQLLNKEYRERWHMILEEMKEQKYLTEDLNHKEKWLVVENVSGSVSRCLSEIQQIL